MEGRDTSVYQGVKPREWFAQWDFVIMRAYDDAGNIDRAFRDNWTNAAGQTARGAYGWPGRGAKNAARGAMLVSLAPEAEFGYWADYENVGGVIPTVAELETYVRAASDASGGRAGFYSNLSELPRTEYLDSVPWWFANPSQNPAPRPWAVEQYDIIDNVDADRAPTNPFGDDDMTPEQAAQLAENHDYLMALKNGGAFFLNLYTAIDAAAVKSGGIAVAGSNTAADRVIAAVGRPDLEATLILAARKAIASSPKGTAATKADHEARVEAAIRVVFG